MCLLNQNYHVRPETTIIFIKKGKIQKERLLPFMMPLPVANQMDDGDETFDDEEPALLQVAGSK